MRLLTRSNFDGLICAVLLCERGVVSEYEFVHPKDIQDGSVEVNGAVLADIPYHESCSLWFDHHSSESKRIDIFNLDFNGSVEVSPSTAQVIWDYYGGEKFFKPSLKDQLKAVNQADSAKMTANDILNPRDWILLSFIMDPRTGLGRFHDYRISNYQLMHDMVSYCRSKNAGDILKVGDVQERTKRYFKHQIPFKEMLKKNVRIENNVIITNLLNEETIYCGNRFIVYALYPEQNIEIRIMWGKENKNVIFACGHSILNRSCKTDIGKLMLKHGGGGHKGVGTCQVSVDKWEAVLEELILNLKEN